MLFLLKPHVTGPGGDVTSPDVVVDHLVVDGGGRPLSALTTEAWQQSPDGEARGAYAVMALGGGDLLLPAVVLGPGPVVVSRRAWRLGSLDGHAGRVTLNGAPLSEVGPPEEAVAAVAGGAAGGAAGLPRGLLVVRTAPGRSLGATLDDPVRGRRLEHRVVAEDVSRDRWGGARPRPRYSVGPTRGDVRHYI